LFALQANLANNLPHRVCLLGHISVLVLIDENYTSTAIAFIQVATKKANFRTVQTRILECTAAMAVV